MPSTQKKTKGHRSERVKFHVPFYNTTFFNQDLDKEEEKATPKNGSMVKIPMKIEKDGDESRSNITVFEISSIKHFDNNVENVLNSISQLEERIIKPKGMKIPVKKSKQQCS